MDENTEIELGPVKILQIDDSMQTEIPKRFSELSPEYCSLGSSLSYYEALADLPIDLRDSYLSAMRDIAVHANIRGDFRSLAGYSTSLLRDPAAEEALDSAKSILLGEEITQAIRFDFVNRQGTELKLNFTSSAHLPGRINAIIGYNGSGKTRILADLAHVASTGRSKRGDVAFSDRYGQLSPDIRFSSTVAVSFSPFDTFELPHVDESSDAEEQYSYVYCGLRSTSSFQDDVALKSIEIRRRELVDALQLLKSNKRKRALAAALEPILQEPSFTDSPHFSLNVSEIERIVNDQHDFRRLSSGHQIVLSVVILLAAHMQIGSLALIDEPETHLHPPLLAALIKAILLILDATESFAVVATHSPIVLQEVPSAYVNIIKRQGGAAAFHKPRFETYGENLDVLTSEAFHRDNTESTYEGHLIRLARELSPYQILNLFPKGISSQALSILMQAGFRIPRGGNWK
jgi:predicted ATPase